MTTIIVTGGSVFIGSHTCIELLKQNYKIIIIDNLVNSSQTILSKIKLISNKNIIFFKRDLSENLDDIFIHHSIHAVIHFAALKSVSDSINNPLLYYKNNIESTINLLITMEKFNCYNFIFSSSATVYGNQPPPLTECTNTGTGITNPYGQTKFMLEQILKDLAHSNPKFNIVALRYFNPIGAHPSGIIGESSSSPSTNLMPHVLRAAASKIPLTIFGDNYDTPDGTCIRDYIHVVDVADAHVLALKKMKLLLTNYHVFNVGLGNGTSVLELVRSFESINNVIVPRVFANKRPGDLPTVFCSTKKIKSVLNFKPKYSIEDACKHAWNFHCKNSLID